MKYLATLLAVCFLLTGCNGNPQTITGFSMDAPYSIKITGKADIAEIKKYLADCDGIFSAYDENSLLYSLNQKKDLIVNTEYENQLLDIINIGKKFSKKYSGVFDIAIRPVTKLWDFNDPKIPDYGFIKENLKFVNENNIIISEDIKRLTLINNAEIDLGAIAKGYAADKIAEKTPDSRLIIDIGGTIKSTMNRHVKIGVKAPDSDGLLCSIEIDNEAVSTSGSYERSFSEDGKLYHHILSPLSGYPSESGLTAVSVVGKSAAVCDILSTTFFILGIEKSLEIIEENNVEAIFVTDNNKVYITKGIKKAEMISKNYTLEN